MPSDTWMAGLQQIQNDYIARKNTGDRQEHATEPPPFSQLLQTQDYSEHEISSAPEDASALQGDPYFLVCPAFI